MKYASAPTFRDALEQRLRAQAHESGASLQRLRKRVAFERFLARLVVAAPDRWLLKGAFALELRLGLQTRTTKDIDLVRSDGEQGATEDLIAATAIDLGDFFVYSARRAQALDAESGFHVVRYTVVCELAGRRWEQFPVDIGLAEPTELRPERLRSLDLLALAGIDAPELPVVAPEQHIADKLHAYTARYRTTELSSTRSKDLIDIVLVAGLVTLDAEVLRAALESTFTLGARQPLSDALPAPPDGRTVPYAKLAAEVGLDTDLAAGHSEAGRLLDPVLARTAGGSWDPAHTRWSGRSR